MVLEINARAHAATVLVKYEIELPIGTICRTKALIVDVISKDRAIHDEKAPTTTFSHHKEEMKFGGLSLLNLAFFDAETVAPGFLLLCA